MDKTKRTPAIIAELEEVIAGMSSVGVKSIRGEKRDKRTADARAMVWLIAFRYMGFTAEYLGDLYGRTHSTIIRCSERIKETTLAGRVINKLTKTHPHLVKKVPGNADDRYEWDI